LVDDIVCASILKSFVFFKRVCSKEVLFIA